MNIELPYKIGQQVWIIRQILYVSEYKKLYIRKEENYEEYQETPIYNQKWIKEKVYLHEYIFNESNWSFRFSNNKWTTNYEEMIHVYESEIFIFDNEQKADEKLKNLSN